MQSYMTSPSIPPIAPSHPSATIPSMDLAIPSSLAVAASQSYSIDTSSLLLYPDAFPQTVLFLGQLYPEDILPPEDPWAQEPLSLSADPQDLLRWVAHAQPVYRRRSIYRRALTHARDSAEDFDRRLHAEETTFEQNLWQDLRKRGILPGSGQVVEEHALNGNHWRWFGPPPRRGEPAVNALGMTYVPVYRLLHPYYRLFDPMLVHFRPTRYTPFCWNSNAEDDAHPCVNPFHFLWRPIKQATRPWVNKNGKPSNTRVKTDLPTYNVPWYQDRVGDRFCAVRHHRLSETYQRRVDMPRTVYCAACYRIRQEERRESSQRRRAGDPSETARIFAAEIEAQVEAQEKAQARGLPEVWDTGERTI